MSDAEEALAFQLRALKITFNREVQFAPPRKWRADFMVTGRSLVSPILIEVDGGTWAGGRHTTGAGFAADCEKLNEATLLGYRVLRVTPSMVTSGAALALVERALSAIGRTDSMETR
jgi:very-short-patch-repair endonuclease